MNMQESLDLQTEIRIMSQLSSPFAYDVAGIALASERDFQPEGEEINPEVAMYLLESEQFEYGDEVAWD